MASDINRVVLTARLTRDPELRRTQSGMAILNLGLAFNDRRKNPQTGEWEDVGNFADAVMFGTRSESLAGFLHKGSRIAVEGKLRYSSWERDGQKRSKLEVLADEVVLLDPKPHDGNQGGYAYGGGNAQQTAHQQPHGQYQREATRQPQQQIDVSSSVYDDDIPF